MLIDQLILCKRKSINLTIQSDGKLVVRAPIWLSQDKIQRFVDEHADWVRKKRAFIKLHPPQVKHVFKSGEQFHYLGQPVRLVVLPRNRLHQPLRYVPASTDAITIFEMGRTTQTHARELLVDWYKKQARRVCTERTAALAKQYSFCYTSLRITSARTRWGSCSSKGTLSFTYRLIMLPPDIIDYVIIHELVHTIIHNHSTEFWRRVETLLPDYKNRRIWINKNGGKYTF